MAVWCKRAVACKKRQKEKQRWRAVRGKRVVAWRLKKKRQKEK
jgi:hypothetical protein